ncbi:MAG: hypothetical protein SOR78_01765 [Baileyella intestinalis]|uniref:hypothetical protein n=1 Tax=Baileyella intestinalis TaxID=2606709 RepID=UPI002A75FB69|nr:hypothetical protein [Baileyella intestinalis]MDY2994471.1 hypothetical protein [Baileyella intestinalis]
MAERASTFTRRCTVNPLIGREDEGLGEIQPAPVKRKVLVVGGGPLLCRRFLVLERAAKW